MVDLNPMAVTAIMFSSMLFFMLLGTPLAWALLISGVGSAYFLWGPAGLELLVGAAFSAMDNFLLVSLPLFIFMGLVLQRSGITDDLHLHDAQTNG